MKKFLFLCLLSSIAFAESEEFSNVFDLEVSKEQVIDERENFFPTSTDYSITPKVNHITGEYNEDETDHSISSPTFAPVIDKEIRRYFELTGKR